MAEEASDATTNATPRTGAASDHSVVLKQMPNEYEYTIEVLALTGLIRFHEGAFVREFPREAESK